MTVDYASPPDSLEFVRNEAPLVVVGTIDSLAFEAAPAPILTATVRTVRVERVLRGQNKGDTVRVRSVGGAFPTDDFKGLYFLDSPAEIFTKGGDRVLLLLHQIDGSSEFEILPFAGQYVLTPDGVKIVDGNPLTEVNGATEAELFELFG